MKQKIMLEQKILHQEIETAINNSPQINHQVRNDISNDAIKASNEIRVKWLEGIFIAPWTERAVPDGFRFDPVVSGNPVLSHRST